MRAALSPTVRGGHRARCGVLALLLVAGVYARAGVTITPASGGLNISADTAANAVSPAWTSLGPIVIDEVSNVNRGNIGTGSNVTLVLKCPVGFEFNAAAPPNITFIAGRDIAAASVAVTDAATLTITMTVIGGGNVDRLTIGNTNAIQVRPTAGQPLASGQIHHPSTGGGTAVINGITATANPDGSGGSNFGSLSQVVGAIARLVFTTQPGGASTGAPFEVQPVVAVRDQFGAVTTTGLPTNLIVTVTLSSGSGPLLGTTNRNLGTAGGNGSAAFTDLHIDSPGTDKQLTASAPGLTNAVSAVFAVNGRPVISPIADQVTNEDTPTPAIPFTVSDAETPAAALQVAASSSNTNLLPAANILLGGGGTNRTVVLTPATNQFGSAIVTITVSDGIVAASTAFTLLVNPVNDAPTLNPIANLTINQNSGPTNIALTGISSGAPNETQVLTVTAISSHTNLIPTPTVLYTSPNSTGTLTLAPLTNAHGTATITVTVRDDGGTANGGVDTVTCTFTVAVNAAPQISPIPNQTIAEDTSTPALPFTVQDAETPAASLVVTATSSNTNLVPHANLLLGGSGTNRTLTARPATNQFGVTTITLTVSDGWLSSSTAFQLAVTPVNDPPEISVIPDQNLLEDQASASIPFTIFDVETPAAGLSGSAASSNTNLVDAAGLVLGGAATNRTLTLIPRTNQFGSATISVLVSDGTNVTTWAFALTVTPVNDPPTLNPLTNLVVSLNPGPQAVPLSGITSGAPNEEQTLTLTATSSDTNIVPHPVINYVSPATTGVLIFTPRTNASGTVTITVTVRDNGGTNHGGVDAFSRQFTVTVLPRADLALGQLVFPDPAYAGGTVTFTLVVTNQGPSPASGIVVSNSLPPGAELVAVTPSQETVSVAPGLVVFSLGTLTNRGAATISVQVTVVGNSMTNRATVSSPVEDLNPTNNLAEAMVAVLPPGFAISGLTLTAESCPNAVVDPAETVTVQFALTNFAGLPVTNLVAILRAVGGVTSPSGAQTYGSLAAGGPAVSHPFTFTAAADCGGTLTATLHLQDGNRSLGAVSQTLRLGATFTNVSARAQAGPFAIPSFGTANPYPSVIEVTNLFGPILKATVTLHQLNHTQPDDLDILLVGPAGQKVMLMSDCGGVFAVTNLTLTFDDAAAGGLPDSVAIASGTYRPTDFQVGDVSPPPAPPGPYGTSLAALNGTTALGAWRLFIFDDFGGFSGSMAGGWTLTLTTLEPICCIPTNSVNLDLQMTAAPAPVIVGNPLTFTFGITNRGPATATSVTLTNSLPAESQFMSATVSQGSFTNLAGVLRFQVGTLASNGFATGSLTLRPLQPGLFTNRAVAAAAEPDHTPANNAVAVVVTVDVPTASLVDNPAVVEGPPGSSTNVWLSVRLAAPSSQTISLAYATADDSAVAGLDYVATNGVLVFAPGETTQLIRVTVLGDALNEATEFFFVNLFDPTNVTLAVAQAVVTITDDDPFPLLFLGDTAVAEGHAGMTNALFPVTLTPAGGQTVFATYVTSNGTARAGEDYVADLGIVVFEPGQTQQFIAIPILGDTVNESNETFFVELFGLVNAEPGRLRAVGTIVNDDFLATIVGAGATLAAESCSPTNGVLDPNETVTVQFALRNVSAGSAQTTNLTATLLPLGGVIFPEGPQFYGALTSGGAAVARPFTFTVNGTCGGTVMAVLQLQDGAASLGRVTNLLTLGVATFTNVLARNPTPVSIPSSGPGAPYPSTLVISGVTGTVANVTVTLSNLNHTYPDDLDVLLVSPDGRAVMLMSDAGIHHALVNVNLTFDDAAPAPVPDNAPITSGTWRPADYEPPDQFPAPASNPPCATNLAAFRGANPNGTWSVYVLDDTGGDAGELTGGWSLQLTVAETPLCCGRDSAADLALGSTLTPNPVVVGSNLTWTLQVTNRGPDPAADVILTALLPAGMSFLSVTSTVGVCSHAGGTVTCNLSVLTNNAPGTVTIVGTATRAGALTNAATLSARTADPLATNSSVVAVARVLPVVSITAHPAALAESSTNAAWFTIRRTGGTIGPLVVQFTVSGTATSGVDFAPLGTSVAIPDGAEMAAVPLVPLDDLLVEPTESVVVTLAASTNYFINPAASSATVSLLDDDTQAIVLARPPALRLVSLVPGPTNVVIRFESLAGNGYRVERTEALGPAATWVTVADNIPGTGGVVTVTDSTGGALSAAFYRVVLLSAAGGGPLIVPEGGTAAFGVRLQAQPLSNVVVTVTRTSGDTNLSVVGGNTLTFTATNWNVPQTVTIAAAPDANAVNGQAVFTLSSPGLTNVTVTAMELDRDVQFLIASVTSLVVVEGGSNSFTVRLNAQPTNQLAVTTTCSSGDTNLAVVAGGTLTFTPGNWNVPQTVVVAAAEDDDIANGVATFTLSAPGMTNLVITVTEADNDFLNLVVEPAVITVPEGGSNSFTVRLSAQPTNAVTVTTSRTSGDPSLAVAAGGTLIFTPANWNMPQSVILRAAEDPDHVNGQALFTVASPGLVSVTVTARGADNDVLGLLVATVAGPRILDVRTNGADVLVTFDSQSNTLYRLEATAELIPPGWVPVAHNLPGTGGPVTVVDAGGAEQPARFYRVAALNPAGTGLLAVPEGGSNGFTVRLSAAPTNDLSVTISRSSGDTDLTVAAGGSLLFTPTNWAVPQAVTLAAAEDDDAVNGQAVFTVAAVGLTNVVVTAVEVENDELLILVSTNLLLVPEGGSNSFTVRLSAEPPTNVMVNVGIITGATNLSLLSTNTLIFAVTNWNEEQPVMVAAAEDEDDSSSEGDVVLSADGLNEPFVMVIELDNDQPELLAAVGPSGKALTLSIEGQDVVLRFTAENGVRYRVEKAETPAAGEWLPVGEVTGAGGPVSVRDWAAAHCPAQFYRLRVMLDDLQ